MIILAIILIKCNFKIAYKVTVDGTKVGYVTDKNDFTCMISNKVLNQDNKNIELVVLNEIPKYSIAIVNKNKKTDEESIISILKLKAETTYRMYAITLNGEDKAYVDTLDDAKEKMKELAEKYKENSEFAVREVYTDNVLEYKNMKYATTTKLVKNLDAEIEAKKEAEKAKALIPVEPYEPDSRYDQYVNKTELIGLERMVHQIFPGQKLGALGIDPNPVAATEKRRVISVGLTVPIKGNKDKLKQLMKYGWKEEYITVIGGCRMQRFCYYL